MKCTIFDAFFSDVVSSCAFKQIQIKIKCYRKSKSKGRLDNSEAGNIGKETHNEDNKKITLYTEN